MGKIDANSLKIKMMASYLHYLATNRCPKHKSLYQDFIRFHYWPSGLVVRTLAFHPGDLSWWQLKKPFCFKIFFLCMKNQLYSVFWWYKPRSVEVIWILLIFSFLFAQSGSKLCALICGQIMEIWGHHFNF